MHPSAELPLIAFTLFSQLSVGIMIISPFILSGCADTEIAGRILGQRIMALLFIALAAILSLIHLGTPLHSPFTILNVGSSWLSREIFLVILICVTLAVSVFLTWKGKGRRLADWLYYASALLGLVLLYAMSRVYNSPFMPGWAGGQTFFLFLATALLLGSLWLGCAISFKTEMDSADGRPILWKIFFTALAGFALLAICSPLSITGNSAEVNPLTINYTADTLARWRAIQALLCGFALVLLAMAVWKNVRGKRPSKWLVLALITGVGGEIAGRCAFYMAYSRLGM